MEEKKRPVKEIRDGNVRFAIWENETPQGVRYSITATRLYRTKDGKWQNTSSMRPSDLAHLAFAAAQTSIWLRSQNEQGEADEAA